MNDDEYGGCIATLYERAHSQGFDKELTREDLNGTGEPPTDNYFSGQQGSPDHTLVYNAVYQSCRDLTTCGSWDEIHSSTPRRKSHGIHLKNLSAISVNQSITEYAQSFLSLEMVEQIPSSPECGAGRPTWTCLPDIPTIQNSSEDYPINALSTPPSCHLSTGSPSTYISLPTLSQGVHGKVFTARLKDNKIYTLKAIPKTSLVQELTKELWILRFITDASLSNNPFPFIQKFKENFQDEKNLFIVLEYFPSTLAHTETAALFRLPQKTTSSGLLPSPSKTYQSEQGAIQALRLLVAELTLGLLFLHRHGIIHQDIRPANVMISEGGHAVIGEFSAASILPVLCPGDDPFERPLSPSCVDKDGMTHGSIVLQPEDTVIFTSLYAAPELLERKRSGLLIYDERVDWWSLGVSLYEITTGGIPFHVSSDADPTGGVRRSDDENCLLFDLLEGLDLTSAARGCDTHLDGYLRSLLVRDPGHRLSGEKAKSHPFLEPLQDIWAEIEDRRHPPCRELSARREDIDILFGSQEDSSKVSCSRRVFESPESSLDREYHTPREVFSSPEPSSLESPQFLTRRKEALAVKRPGGQVFWNDDIGVDSNGPLERGESLILQQEAFMSYYIESSFQINESLLVGNPPSSDSGRFFSDEHSYGTCTIQRQPQESFDKNIVRGEISFTDSGLDFPLGSSPESWGHRKSDPLRKPLALRPIYGQRLKKLTKDREGQIYGILARPKVADLPEHDWTFDEKITISLLQASLREQERSEPTVGSCLSKPRSVVAAVSERIIRAAGRRVAEVLRRRP